MVSYYHQVYSLTALRELVLPLTLPWCRTTTKSSLTLTLTLSSLSLTLPWCRTTTKSTHSHFHGVVLPPSLPTHCSERTCAPTHTSMVSYYHQVYSHTVFSLTHSPIHVIPVNTSMVSYYHQVYPLTALRELVLPLTLPWCRTTTKCTLTLSSLSHTLPSMSSLSTLPWCRTTTKSTHSLL